MKPYTNLSDVIVDGVVESSAQGRLQGSFTVMPTASADNEGCVVTYIGATTSAFTQYATYVCIKSGNRFEWKTASAPAEINLTANKAVISNSEGKPVSSNVTSTELGYVSGVTSGIQTQINSVSGNVARVEGKIPTNNNQLTNGAGYATTSYVDSRVTSVYRYKGNKPNKSSLPGSGNSTGDVWNVTDTDMNYAWDGSKWDAFSGTVDLSGYATKSELNALTSRVQALENIPNANSASF